MIRKVNSFIREKQLIEPGQHVLAAVSGGADSVCLLYVLKELASSMELKITVAHLNHRIRGKAADMDETSVRSIARSLGVHFVGAGADVPAMARRGGVSIEMAARKARYSFFKKTAKAVNADVVVTAHHSDDQAETVLLNLARGTGPRGLGGIPASINMKGLKVVRPMLCVSRDEIAGFLNKNGIKWREDESNNDVSFLRNSVRHELIPLLESRLNPKVKQTLVRTAELIREEDQWLDCLAEELLKDCVDSKRLISRAAGSLPVAARRRVVRLWLLKRGIAPDDIDFEMVARVDALLIKQKGTGRVNIVSDRVVRKEYEYLMVEKIRPMETPAAFRAKISVNGITMVMEAGLRIEASVAPGLVRPDRARAGNLPARASLRYATIGRKSLIIRSYQPGDRMKPFGMKGSKKLQDIFVDHKVPRERRGSLPVFECGGEIVWLPGYNIARGWEVVDDTEMALQLYVERV